MRAHISCGGYFIKNIQFTVGSNASQLYKFEVIPGCVENTGRMDNVHLIAKKIQKLLNSVRAERKRIAQEALSKGTVPKMIFCKYCGAKNTHQ